MKVKISRNGSNWGGKKFKVEEIDNLPAGLDWMNKHGYKCLRAYNGKVTGRRIMEFTKPGCDTYYTMTVL